MFKNRESTEKLQRYASRVKPIDEKHPATSVNTGSYNGSVSLKWQQRPNDYESYIVISFTDSRVAREKPKEYWFKRPRIILSALEIGEDVDTKLRNPFDSIRAVLTILAVINHLSQKFGRFTHIVRANEYSQPLFDLLCDLGIYHISDEVGKRVDEPKKWYDKYTLYSCNYPVNCLPDLSAYVPKEFVAVLEKQFTEDAMRLQDPLFRRIMDIFTGFGKPKQNIPTQHSFNKLNNPFHRSSLNK